MLIAEVDEAGRGPVIGPMVIGVCVIEKKDEDTLVELGVKDSKELSPKKRNTILKELKKILLEQRTVKIFPDEIDGLRSRKSLNEIEAMRIGELLNSLKQKPEVVFVDSPDTVMKNFATRIKKYLSFDCIIKSEHRADSTHPIVSAASIFAKVERDSEIKKLEEIYGRIGSGYAHDETTISFLKKWLDEKKCLPPCTRRSWDTSKNILDERFQQKLFRFME
jgi:ribonuclease HII